MRRVRARTGAVRTAVVAILVGATAACGAGGDGDPSPEPTGALDAYLDEIFASTDAETWVAQHDAVEEYLAACMAEEGFEYRPTEAPPMYTRPDPLTPEYAAEFGYGDSTEAYGPDVPPMRFSTDLGDPAAEFNQSYAYGLAPEGFEQYMTAMHGREPLPGEDFRDIPPEEAGCRSRAYEEVSPESRLPAQFRPLEDAIREEIWWVDEDPRVVATHPAWADCMADAGYPGLVDVMDAAALANDRANASSLTLAVPYAELKSMFPEELAEVQAYEVAVATADAACREEAGWYDVRADVLLEAQASILERYRPELDAWLEWVREQRRPVG
ncbi:hypothetical protein [Actinotalea fermentans]|uniref:hypothetical protein n=1 Tax=Actinotalea fermentans TaxID=43671 RepID=UPI0011BF378F|nr:hypothetical protein [Actinotalea fermentans]